MAELRISDLPAHSTGTLKATDLIEVSEESGGLFTSTKMTGAQIVGGLVWKALITQTGTNAPVLTVVKNTLGVTITPSYLGIGAYQLSGFAGHLIAGDVEIYGNVNHVGDRWGIELEATTDSILSLASYEEGTGYLNGILDGIGNCITVIKY